MKYTRLRRICKRCSAYFFPDGKFQKYCLECTAKGKKPGKDKYRKNIKKKKILTKKQIVAGVHTNLVLVT
jgi:hypothetical protein